MKNIISLLLVFSLLSSCDYFSNNKEEKKREAQLKYKKKKENIENKNYRYVNQLVSYKSNVQIDTVAIVLKEYYKTYREYSFNEETDKLEELDIDYSLDEVNKLDFVENVIKKHNINEKTAFLIFDEIDSFFKIQQMGDNIDSIDSTVDDIEMNLPDN